MSRAEVRQVEGDRVEPVAQSGEVQISQPKPAPASTPPLSDPAPLWRRLVARATDLLVVLCIQFVLVVLQIFWFMDDLSQRYDFEPWGRSFMASMIYLGLYACYEVYFHTFAGGQTPGKIFMKIEVARLSDGRPPVWWQSLARWPVAGVALPLLFAPDAQLWLVHYKLWAVGLWLLPGVTALITPARRSLPDLLAGTQVVRHIQTEEETQQLEDMKRRRTELREKYGLGRFGPFNRLR